MWQKILAFLKSVWEWIRTDGLLHIACEALIVAAFGWLRPIWIPALIALAAGIGKEVYDYFHPESHSRLPHLQNPGILYYPFVPESPEK